MELKRLLTEDDAVSPVIGVILMVAITVILAAVIGTFVLGLGQNVQSSQPSTSFTVDYNSGTTSGISGSGSCTVGSGNRLDVTHSSGEQIKASDLKFVDGDGNEALFDTDCGYNSDSDITAGTTTKVEVDSDDTVRVVWTGGGSGGATLRKWTGPDA